MIRSGGGNGIVRHFDLVAGTSTGAILAIGLGLGLSPLQMLEFYRVQGPKIFPKNRELRHWLKSKHESKTLRATLQSVFGDRKLTKDSCCRLVIPTVRAFHGEAETIVTAHSPDRTAFALMSAVDAAVASSAAPTYFDEAFVGDNIAVAGRGFDAGIEDPFRMCGLPTGYDAVAGSHFRAVQFACLRSVPTAAATAVVRADSSRLGLGELPLSLSPRPFPAILPPVLPPSTLFSSATGLYAASIAAPCAVGLRRDSGRKMSSPRFFLVFDAEDLRGRY